MTVLQSNGLHVMNTAEPRVLLSSPLEGTSVGQALYVRTALREQTRLQAQFLEQLGKSPFSQQFVLCGGAALHGVFLHRRSSANLDLYAPAVIVARFNELAIGCGIGIEKARVHNSFVLQDRSMTLKNLRIGIRLSILPSNALKWERKLFVTASGRAVPVNVLPLVELVGQKLLLVMQRMRAVDVLDIWLALNERPELIEALDHIVNADSGLKATFPVSLEQISSRLSCFKGDWVTSLEHLIYPVPEFDIVFQDLRSSLARIAASN